MSSMYKDLIEAEAMSRSSSLELGIEAEVSFKLAKPVKKKNTFETIEKELGTTLPDDFKKIAKLNSNGRPVKRKYDVSKGNTIVVEKLLSMESGIDYILDLTKCLKDKVKKGTFPIMKVSGGNFICYNQRNRVVLLETEKGKEIPLEDTFTAFLDKLHS